MPSDASCTETGYATYTCTACGEELSRETVVVPATGTSEDEDEAEYVAILRLYNPYAGEHLYTTDENKVEVLTELGWGSTKTSRSTALRS